MTDMRTCRWCQNSSAAVDTSGVSYCDQCRRWDTSACLVCRTTAGFPRPTAQVTNAQALGSPVLRHEAITEVDRQAERIVRKSFIYCPRCYHGAYFVTKHDDMHSRCLLCSTVWKRTSSAEHAIG